MIGDLIKNDAAGGALGRFTRDLTADARAGRLEPVRCREQEVSRVTDILLRHGKNNPALVGPAGVGKTAIADGLAQRIVEGRVPFTLRDVRVLSLDHVGLLAGTTWRGQYEERVRSLVAEVTAAPDVILLTDEHVSDRMRPDKAIDALDEACAHLQAEAQYSPRLQGLIKERAALVRAPAPRETEREAPAGDGGLNALERFGAELEAILIGE